MRITGILLVAEEPREFSGKSQKGKDYHFCQQRLQLFTGKGNVSCTIRRDTLKDFGALPLGAKVTFKVISGRMDNAQMVFDVEG